jgi:hypothetical protein
MVIINRPQEGHTFLKLKDAQEVGYFESEVMVVKHWKFYNARSGQVEQWTERESKLEAPLYFYELYQRIGE